MDSKNQALKQLFQDLIRKKDIPCIKYRKGMSIYQREEPAYTLCYLIQGIVSLSLRNKNGNTYIFHIVEEGDFFGLDALDEFKNRRYPKRLYDSTAFRDSEVAHLPISIFYEEQSENLYREIIEILNKEQREISNKIEEYLSRGDLYRTITTLLDIKDKIGEKNPKGIDLDILGIELSSLVWCSEKEISRALQKLKKRGAVERIQPGKIRITDEEKLRELLEMI